MSSFQCSDIGTSSAHISEVIVFYIYNQVKCYCLILKIMNRLSIFCRRFHGVLFESCSTFLRGFFVKPLILRRNPEQFPKECRRKPLFRAVDSNFNRHFCEDECLCYLQIAIAKMNAFGFNGFIRCG